MENTDGLVVASNMLNDGLSINSLRANATTLRHEEWIEFDPKLVKAYQNRLRGIADLYKAGLVYKMSNGLARTILTYEMQSDISTAEMSMDGVSRSKGDRPLISNASIPLPMIFKNFEFNARVLAESRRFGEGLDARTGELAARKVAEYAEQLLFNGSGGFAFSGHTLYGYLTAPNRTTRNLEEDWALEATTGADILEDVRGMKQDMINDKRFGPYKVYIPTAYETKMEMDYTTSYPVSIRERILKIDGITSVEVSDQMTAGNVIMVQLDSETIRLVEGMPLTTWETKSEFEMIHRFKVGTILVPQIYSDYNDKCGIVHLRAD